MNNRAYIESFQYYFSQNTPKLPKGFKYYPISIYELGIGSICPNFSFISNKIEKAKKWKGSRAVIVIDEYCGIKRPELIPNNSIIFTSNEMSDNLECEKIYIPLLKNIKSDIEFIKPEKRKYKYNFIGAKSHRIRLELQKFNYENSVISFNKMPVNEYYNIIANSVFTLCPRGVNVSSYRICEALRFGSIPVYISDDFILTDDWSDYGIGINSYEIDNLPNILSDYSLDKINEMIICGKEYYNKLFTFSGLSNWIVEKLKTIE